ncbi:hypothetical protein ACIPZF_03770 [Pseudomonas sp. NPDC089752]|uniref:hypothetical protein n=1 Tax=Pseudomonas sp. NPDC089752 TaxID=3364472 RepID=UPI00380C7E6A
MANAKQVITSVNTSDGIFQLFEALMRIVQGRPIRVPTGTAITLKSVALEAGKSPGIIKKQRPVYAELIKEIKRCAAEQKERGNPKKLVNEATRRWKEEAERSKNLYHQSLARELMLLHQLDEAEHLLRNSENVLNFPSRSDVTGS